MAIDTDYLETHYEVVAIIERERAREPIRLPIIEEIDETQGTGGFWELAQELASDFQEANKDRDWDGEFYDELEKFVAERIGCSDDLALKRQNPSERG